MAKLTPLKHGAMHRGIAVPKRQAQERAAGGGAKLRCHLPGQERQKANAVCTHVDGGGGFSSAGVGASLALGAGNVEQPIHRAPALDRVAADDVAIRWQGVEAVCVRWRIDAWRTHDRVRAEGDRVFACARGTGAHVGANAVVRAHRYRSALLEAGLARGGGREPAGNLPRQRGSGQQVLGQVEVLVQLRIPLRCVRPGRPVRHVRAGEPEQQEILGVERVATAPRNVRRVPPKPKKLRHESRAVVGQVAATAAPCSQAREFRRVPLIVPRVDEHLTGTVQEHAGTGAAAKRDAQHVARRHAACQQFADQPGGVTPPKIGILPVGV